MQSLSAQRGGTIVGFILGVVVGLAIAFGVAVYMTKLPVPFLTGENPRPPIGSSVRGDINAPLSGGVVVPIAPTPTAPVAPVAPPATAPAPVGAAPPTPGAPAAVSADPLGDLAQAQLKAADAKPTATVSSTGISYFVQVGAFRSQADAEAQRAKLAMLNQQARVTEREQNGRPVFRVRVGPFAQRAEAEQAQSALKDAGLEASLVRVQP